MMHRFTPIALVAALAAMVLLQAGCVSSPPAPTTTSSVTTSMAAPAVKPTGQPTSAFTVSGAVLRPGRFDLAALQALTPVSQAPATPA